MNTPLNLALLISIGLFGNLCFSQNQTRIRIQVQMQGANNGLGGGVFRVGGGVSAPLILQKVEAERPWPNANIELEAAQLQSDGSLVHMKGDAEIRTLAVVVRADEVDFNQDSLEVEARGNVRIQLLKPK